MRLKIAFLGRRGRARARRGRNVRVRAQKLEPGVTAKTVHIGGTFPFSGPAALYSAIPTAEKAYFLYVNAHGGVNGRKIQFTYYDDAYDPSKSVPLTQKLVEQDKVFADFGSLGTAPILATRGLPEPEEGASGAGRDRATRTGAPRPSSTRGRSAGSPTTRARRRSTPSSSTTTSKQAKIGVLYQNDAYGTNYLNAFKGGARRQVADRLDAVVRRHRRRATRSRWWR